MSGEMIISLGRRPGRATPLYLMTYTGKLRPKGVPFSCFRRWKGSNTRVQACGRGLESMNYIFWRSFPFLSKMVYKRPKGGLNFGAESFRIKLCSCNYSRFLCRDSLVALVLMAKPFAGLSPTLRIVNKLFTWRGQHRVARTWGVAFPKDLCWGLYCTLRNRACSTRR